MDQTDAFDPSGTTCWLLLVGDSVDMPSWRSPRTALDSQQAQALRDMVSEASKSVPVAPPALSSLASGGYRGAWSPQLGISCFAGRVGVQVGGSTTWFADEGREIEGHVLLAMADDAALHEAATRWRLERLHDSLAATPPAGGSRNGWLDRLAAKRAQDKARA